VGDTVTFTIVGDLTIRDITHEATFEVEATAVSPTQISGLASTTIDRTTYGLNIPSVPQVANVEEEVELYIDFVADALEE
jgi:polyisoprenoid-binding protein YceI